MSWQIALYDLDFIDKILKLVISDKEKAFGVGVITSLYRVGDKGVHGTLPLRALDERCRHKPTGTMIEDYINSKWTYDPDRPEMRVCMYHDVGKGPHLHYQVHPKTIRNVG